MKDMYGTGPIGIPEPSMGLQAGKVSWKACEVLTEKSLFGLVPYIT